MTILLFSWENYAIHTIIFHHKVGTASSCYSGLKLKCICLEVFMHAAQSPYLDMFSVSRETSKIFIFSLFSRHIHIKRSRQMAFPILMSAGKVQYFCHLPLLWVHYNKKEALNSVFICLSIWKLHLIWSIRPCLSQYWVIHIHEVLN